MRTSIIVRLHFGYSIVRQSYCLAHRLSNLVPFQRDSAVRETRVSA
jgi:hypothetical protein